MRRMQILVSAPRATPPPPHLPARPRTNDRAHRGMFYPQPSPGDRRREVTKAKSPVFEYRRQPALWRSGTLVFTEPPRNRCTGNPTKRQTARPSSAAIERRPAWRAVRARRKDSTLCQRALQRMEKTATDRRRGTDRSHRRLLCKQIPVAPNRSATRVRTARHRIKPPDDLYKLLSHARRLHSFQSIVPHRPRRRFR